MTPRSLFRGAAIGAVVISLVGAGCSTADTASTKTTAASVDTTAAAASTVAPTTAAATVTTSAAAATSSAPATTVAVPAGGQTADTFTGTAAFCKVGAPAPTGSVQIVQVRNQLEQLDKIGFNVPVGDPIDIFQVFADEINKCGGVGGKKIEMKTVEYSSLDPASRDKVCVAATEDNKPLVVVNSTSLQGPPVTCIAVEKKVPFIGTQGAPEADYKQANGRLSTIDVSLEGSLRNMADYLVANHRFDGKKIGVVTGDLAGLDKVTKESLVDYLATKGVKVAAFETIGCAGAATCGAGIPPAVESFKNAGVDVVLPTLNIVSLPAFIKEMATQGMKATFYQSNFNSMGGDLPTDKVVAFGGPEAAALYNGATVIDWQATGVARVPNYKPDAFSDMCNATYAKGTKLGLSYSMKDTPVPFGMVGTVCSIMRIVGRSGAAAGKDLNGDTFGKAMSNLGPVDLNLGIPGSLRPDKMAMPDQIHTSTVVYPCPTPEFKSGCVIPTTDPPIKING